MSELMNLIAIDEAIETLNQGLNSELTTEKVAITEAGGRILAQDLKSEIDLPPFSRSTMDGYALKAEDTFGASENLPAYLDVVGEVKMGEKAETKINSGQAVAVPTGGMMPPGADAVVMVEYTEKMEEDEIEVTKSVAVGENIVQQGEDIAAGDSLLAQGHLLRSQDIGALTGIGITEVEVFAVPQVTVFSTGDELIPPEEEPEMGEIRDINSYALGSRITKLGATVNYGGIISDRKEELITNLEAQLDKSDLIILSGGSSVGIKDLTIEVLNELGEPGVLVHGVSIKPGKPTILAIIDDTPVIGLPGHPTSAMVVFEIVVVPIIQKLAGRKEAEIKVQSQVSAKLSRNVASAPGREEYFRVSLEERDNQLWATPSLGKSSLITTMVEADGLAKVGLGTEGVKQGGMIPVILFD
ncbi:molybdopterin molybdotransferase MoeA [Halanaerobacter jeridensis]|uniref:Molybdopterin molybdenumtransferase n=1 Tax=Halanaerobacter jeridensis TaxID=706427 RepID=A0A938XXV9_9FIRM|nr:gephyrin-like molybdotransferase Glp [Halanaerobacter jeridensis]MBM7557672.1 molybdopterin molybdotransferase [Halanaerobacter jeridensis]